MSLPIFWITLAASLASLITAIVSLIQMLRVQKSVAENVGHVIRIEHQINGRIDELLETTRKAAQLLGHSEGVKEERSRPHDPLTK